MRVVIDTNVLVSAALKDRSLPALALAFADTHGRLLKSAETERQLWSVLSRPYFARVLAAKTTRRLKSAVDRAETVCVTGSVVACRDPSDDMFLELAANGGADYLVTGDRDLLVLRSFRGIPILTPAAFLRAVRQTP